MAAAIMLHVIKEYDPYIGLEYQEQLIGALKTPEVCNCNQLAFPNSFIRIIHGT